MKRGDYMRTQKELQERTNELLIARNDIVLKAQETLERITQGKADYFDLVEIQKELTRIDAQQEILTWMKGPF